MKIEVTERDIKLGMKTMVSNTKCPVARALHRAGFKNVLVGVSSVSRKDRPDRVAIRLPEHVSHLIHIMCGNNPPNPFSFNLTKRQVATLS
jgi:hypothetical protein